jgi:hypothetical protein
MLVRDDQREPGPREAALLRFAHCDCAVAWTAHSKARTVVLAVHQEPRGRFLVPEQGGLPGVAAALDCCNGAGNLVHVRVDQASAAEVNPAHDALAASGSAWPASGPFELMARASAGALPAAGPLHR